MIRRARATLALPLLLLCACFGRHRGSPADAQDETARHRGALATLSVENATSRHLRIAVRTVPGPAGEITVGDVGAGDNATVAPIPAGEPVVLSAIADDSSRLSLPPRSFDIGERWTWRIAANAVFAPRGELPP
jgi:hypothetical protein